MSIEVHGNHHAVQAALELRRRELADEQVRALEAEAGKIFAVWRGEYAHNPALRAEFLTLCQDRHGAL